MNPYEINLHEYICMNNGAQQNLSQIRKKEYSEFIRGQDMKKSADALLSGSV